MAKKQSKSATTQIEADSNVSTKAESDFSPESLPLAIGTLLELNNYSVEYSKKVNGAEIDLVATSKGDPFAPTIYIEATIQYVDNTKYGKDATKFLLVREFDRRAACLSVSSNGFTPDVAERAKASGIVTNLYSELFSSFEKFSPYADHVLGDLTINALLETYEEPLFRDAQGEELATVWLREWKNSSSTKSPWLVVLGEYGTGKTALTQKIQSNWIEDYVKNPAEPIPFRIELRSFTRQFDARSLIHHFLDTNKLGHVPIDFVFHLIRNRRVILVLDGYDEMAQFLNARERRTCLATLAELASAGAKGILTSRPNYFTETEELHVFEALYTSLERNKYHISQIDRLYIAGERSVDELLENYLINKNERYLRDLTPEQTKALVRRKLSSDPAGQEIVIALLNKIFREEVDGTRQ
ncbi:MAG TPA: NACHT domain-containing protein, partial [Arenimonas sp.]|uniref:NACHT domain-containing protein n=1 Tax=Arenimonas sp. TaxID=1872635 RepID=UPI002D7FB887